MSDRFLVNFKMCLLLWRPCWRPLLGRSFFSSGSNREHALRINLHRRPLFCFAGQTAHRRLSGMGFSRLFADSTWDLVWDLCK